MNTGKVTIKKHMEFGRENFLKAGTETNYDVFTGLVYSDSFNHVLL